MAGDWFFLSYARLDQKDDPYECIRTLYADLDREMRPRKKIKEGSAGFYDGEGIQQGDQWPETLGMALNSCRALICLYSAAYFDSEYCGKEFAVFNRRVQAFMDCAPEGTTRPSLIIPVLLYPSHELGNIPDVLANTQYFDDTYPELYREEGLRYFYKRRNHSDLASRYQDFLDALVAKLLAATANNSVPPLSALPDIKRVESAFHPSSNIPAGASVNDEQAGPRYADFFYVAGRRDEIELLGRRVENYGVEGELDWKPYLPEVPDEVGLIAQSAATKEGFRYQRVALSDNLLTFIKDAETNNRIVILVVDAWTLRLPKYKQWMLNYDRLNFANCAVLVVWNYNDADTARDGELLDLAVRQTFFFRTRLSDSHSFVNKIGSPTDLANMLGITLQRMRAQIIETNNLRRIGTSQMIAKPEITGPGVTVA